MEKKCKHCAMMIPKEAKICPHCRKKQGTSIITLFLSAIFILFVIGMCSSFMNTTTTRSPQSVSKNNDPVLELQSWNWYQEYGYVTAEGTVKNISSESLNNVVAVLQVYDEQGTFISSSDALIDYRPILPGQISPFKVMLSYNPAMKKASIDFKAFSGGTLQWKKKQ
ncbi:MAG: hypothetical protein JW914_02680 [Syntrophaceae bacterium]|nr:hypothetical protein [Syntrophaceae bacterium]